MPLSQTQFKNKHNILLRRIEKSNLKDDVSVSFLNAAKSVLNDYAPSETQDGSISQGFDLPTPEDVLCSSRDALIARSDIFVENTFRQPLRPIVILHDVADLYGLGDVSQDFIHASVIDTTGSELRNVLLRVWLCYIVECDASACTDVVRMYLDIRGSPNALLNRCPTTPGTPTVGAGPKTRPVSTKRITFGGGSAAMPSRPEQSQDPRIQHPTATRGCPFPNRETDPRRGNSEPRHEPVSSGPSGSSFPGTHGNDDSRKANYVQQMFRDSKFGGDLSQDIFETLKLYGICSRQHNLSLYQKADYFVHVFEGAARKFFFENTNEMMSFNDMVQVMLREYVSDARQLQVKGLLETLRLRSFMKEKGIDDVTEALAKLVSHINELSPQCPPDFRSDAHKIDFLRKAVVEFQSWSHIPIQNITSQRYSFNGLVTVLHEAIKNLRQLELLTGEHDRSRSSFTEHIESPYETNMSQYGRNPRFGNTFGRRSQNGNRYKGERSRMPTKPSSFEEARRRNECHKCGASGWRPGHRCEKGAIQAHTRKRLQEGEASVHIVADLVQQMEGETNRGSEDDNGNELDPHLNKHVHFASHPTDLDTFDSLCDQQDHAEPHMSTYVYAIEAVDSEIFASHLSASMGSTDHDNHQQHQLCFRQGDDQ